MSFTYKGVEIDDTYAEGFSMWGSRIVITAASRRWADTAAQTMTGYATSVIACDCEAGSEREVTPAETQDGRPGRAVMVFGFSKEKLAASMLARIGQCVLTCPTTAIFNGVEKSESEAMLEVGKSLRFFGDGFQTKMRMNDGLGDRARFWRIPVMEGEFLTEEKYGAKKGVAGGNFLLMGRDEVSTLDAAERAIEAIHTVPLVITPFPGGLCRSGSKVGSKYAFLKASTNTPFCPTIKHSLRDSMVPDGANSVIEIVLNGFTEPAVKRAMGEGIKAAAGVDGLKRITAVNFGGKLGKFKIGLKDCLEGMQ